MKILKTSATRKNKKYIKQHLEVMKKEPDINFIRIHGALGHSAIFEAADEVGII